MHLSAADADAVNLNGIKSLLADDFSTFIKGKTVASNGSKSLSKNPTDCPIVSKWVFDNFILASKLVY